MSNMKELAMTGELILMGKSQDMKGDAAKASLVIDYLLQVMTQDRASVTGEEVLRLANQYHSGEPMKVRHITTSCICDMDMIVLCLDDPELDEDYGMTYEERLAEHYMFSYVYNVDCPEFSELGDVYLEKQEDGYYHRCY